MKRKNSKFKKTKGKKKKKGKWYKNKYLFIKVNFFNSLFKS